MLHNFLQNIKDSSHNSLAALNNHPQLWRSIDILMQRERHHLLLLSKESALAHEAFAQSLANLLRTETTPQTLQSAQIYYLNLQQIETPNIATELYSISFTEEKKIILIHVPNKFPESLAHTLREYLAHPAWRFIIFTSIDTLEAFPFSSPLFTQLKLTPPNNIELFSILKSQRTSLENYYQIKLHDEMLSEATQLADRYMAGDSLLEKTLILLECSSARINKTTHTTLTVDHLLSTISKWTHIPQSHLKPNHYSINAFTESVQQAVIGQTEAIWTVATVLQHACFRLNHRAGPFCQFLFAGPTHAGKRTLVKAVAHYFLGHHDALFKIHVSQNNHSLDTLQVIQLSAEKMILPFFTAIKEYPYAIFLIEHIESLPSETLYLLENILTDGFTCDRDGNKINFFHAMFFMTTTVGSDIIEQRITAAREKSQTPIDLFTSNSSQITLSNEILNHAIAPLIAEKFPSWLLRHTELVSLTPHTITALENIIQQDIATFIKQFQKQSHVKIQVKPEAIHFLAQKILHKPYANTSAHILEYYLYPRIAQLLTSNPSAQHIIVRLNESGKFILCETSTESIAEMDKLA